MRVMQGSILGPLFFLVFINDLPGGLQSNVRIFADDTSLFSVIIDSLRSSNLLNIDLRLIENWAFQKKNQAIEVISSKKTIHTAHPILTFNNNIICSKDSHKHLGMVLDKMLTFGHHLKREDF